MLVGFLLCRVELLCVQEHVILGDCLSPSLHQICVRTGQNYPLYKGISGTCSQIQETFLAPPCDRIPFCLGKMLLSDIDDEDYASKS